jgi:MFS family permease
LNRKTIFMLALLIPALISTVLATLAFTGHLEVWHVAVGNLVSGTMWATEMSTRRRMVGEVAGPHRIVNAIALDSVTSAATRAIGPLLGGFGTAGFGNMQSTLMLTEAPPEVRSRLMGIVTVCIGTGPLGQLAAGAISDEIGPRGAVIVLAAAGLLLTAWLAWILKRPTQQPPVV